MSESRPRLPPETFDLPVDEIRSGYRSAVYFSRAKRVLEAEKPDTVATVQVFQKGSAVLCGIDEAIAVLRVGAGSWAAGGEWEPGFDQLEVDALHDGDRIEPWETVAHITGPLRLFVHLESVYLGLLARRTKVATNVAAVVDAAKGKPLLFFADRFDHYATQGGDGYAAHVGGAFGVATDAMASWWGGKGLGTIPHGLIAAFGGDTVAATEAFARHVPDADLIALVDFNNDSVGDALACAHRFGERLWGVRLDTAEDLVDRAITAEPTDDFNPAGVNVMLVRLVREALDRAGFRHVRIVVSGGFDAERVGAFEEAGAPVDVYAVGSSLLRGRTDFTADVVAVDGKPMAKVGRRLRPNPRLARVVA